MSRDDDEIGDETAVRMSMWVTKHQKRMWAIAAAKVGMNLSEFVRACADDRAEVLNNPQNTWREI